jgi:hypothetical protein
MSKLLFAGLLILSTIAQAWADCDYQGRHYSTGSRVGNKVCQSDGSWR